MREVKSYYLHKPTRAILQYDSFNSDMDLVRFWVIKGNPKDISSGFAKWSSQSVLMDVQIADRDCARLDMNNPLIKELVE